MLHQQLQKTKVSSKASCSKLTSNVLGVSCSMRITFLPYKRSNWYTKAKGTDVYSLNGTWSLFHPAGLIECSPSQCMAHLSTHAWDATEIHSLASFAWWCLVHGASDFSKYPEDTINESNWEIQTTEPLGKIWLMWCWGPVTFHDSPFIWSSKRRCRPPSRTWEAIFYLQTVTFSGFGWRSLSHI